MTLSKKKSLHLAYLVLLSIIKYLRSNKYLLSF